MLCLYSLKSSKACLLLHFQIKDTLVRRIEMDEREGAVGEKEKTYKILCIYFTTFDREVLHLFKNGGKYEIYIFVLIL